jgi:hypothetical protein
MYAMHSSLLIMIKAYEIPAFHTKSKQLLNLRFGFFRMQKTP